MMTLKQAKQCVETASNHDAHTEVPTNFPCGLQSVDWKAGPEKVMTVCSSPIGQVNGLAAEGMLAIG